MLETILDSIVTSLTAEDINACRAFPDGAIDRAESLVCISLHSLRLTSSGNGNYLGISDTGGTVSEVYGSKAELVLCADAFAPADDGAEACATLLDSLVSVLERTENGVKLRSVNCGEIEFDRACEMFHCRCTVSCTAYLLRSCDDESGEFSDFYLRGEVNGHEC